MQNDVGFVAGDWIFYNLNFAFEAEKSLEFM